MRPSLKRMRIIGPFYSGYISFYTYEVLLQLFFCIQFLSKVSWLPKFLKEFDVTYFFFATVQKKFWRMVGSNDDLKQRIFLQSERSPSELDGPGHT